MSANRYGIGNAAFGNDDRYRYALSRCWDPDLPAMMVIGLNPSTADADNNDPTIRRCIGFAERWGYGALWMGNLFAFRSTDPKGLPNDSRIAAGPGNVHALIWMARHATRVFAAWGTNAHRYPRWADHVLMRLRVATTKRVWCFAKTKGGHPSHPLYLPADIRPETFRTGIDPEDKTTWIDLDRGLVESIMREFR